MRDEIGFERLCQIEPRLRQLVNELKATVVLPDTNIYHVHSDCKRRTCNLVGWNAENLEISDSGSYVIAIRYLFDVAEDLMDEQRAIEMGVPK